MNGYFEGWYFKLENTQEAIALIPAFHREKNALTKASLQIITSQDVYNIDYPFTAFNFQRTPLTIQIGNNHFSTAGISLKEEGKHFHLTGELQFQQMILPKKDIMGPFASLPYMQCYHSLFSLKHKISGSLELNGKFYDFSQGLGYIEGDRGRSFPKEYLWTHCFFSQHSQGSSGSIMLAVADIPLPLGSFTGIIGYILWKGKEYRFTTYYGARIKKKSKHFVQITQGSYALHVTLLEDNSKLLHAPQQGNMNRNIKESIHCSARYQFFENEQLLLDITTKKASFEWMYPDK